MIERYAPRPMRALFSDRARLQRWLAVEVEVCRAWEQLGRIPQGVADRIAAVTIDPDRVGAIEAEVGHDMIAFLTSVSEQVGSEGRWVHLGLTSSDVGDTALAMQLRDAADLLLSDLDKLRAAVTKRAVEHRGTVMVGRTHGIHAEPTTFGLKMLGWLAELDRDRHRLERSRQEIAVGQVSGAVGTHATVDPAVEEAVCRQLGLAVAEVTTQVIQRDRHATLMTTLALLAGCLESMATEIRHLQRTEVGEVLEPFGRAQKGSSAMPHKRNPILCERVCGLARTVRGYCQVALENMVLWHERDISHSSAERIILPDACCLVDYMLLTMTKVVLGMEVRTQRMLDNLDMGGGVIFSQRVLLALVDGGMDREEAYRIVQQAAFAALGQGPGFKDALLASGQVSEHLSAADLEELFQLSFYTRHVDVAFRRLGLEVGAAL